MIPNLSRNRWCERDKNILASAVGGVIGRIVTLATPFIATPIILNYLGDFVFGVWLTAVSAISMAVSLDFGIGNGLNTRLSYHLGRGEYGLMRSYISNAYLVLLASSAIFIVILLGVWSFVSWEYILKNDIEAYEASAVIFVTLLVFLIGLPVSVIQKIMYACQRGWEINIWLVMGSAGSLIATWLSVEANLSAPQVVFSYMFPPVLVMLLSTISFYLRFSYLRPGVGVINKKHLMDLLVIGFKYFCLSVLIAIGMNIDNVIIAHKLGSDVVTNFAVPMKISSLLMVVSATVFLPLWAANGEALAKHDYTWIKKSTLRMSFYGGVSVFIIGLVVVINADSLILMWVGREFSDQTEIIVFSGLVALLMTVTAPFNMLLNASGVIYIQILGWFFLVFFATYFKYVFADVEDLWRIPLLTAIIYLFFVTIPSVWCAYRIFRNDAVLCAK